MWEGGHCRYHWFNRDLRPSPRSGQQSSPNSPLSLSSRAQSFFGFEVRAGSGLDGLGLLRFQDRSQRCLSNQDHPKSLLLRSPSKLSRMKALAREFCPTSKTFRRRSEPQEREITRNAGAGSNHRFPPTGFCRQPTTRKAEARSASFQRHTRGQASKFERIGPRRMAQRGDAGR